MSEELQTVFKQLKSFLASKLIHEWRTTGDKVKRLYNDTLECPWTCLGKQTQLNWVNSENKCYIIIYKHTDQKHSVTTNFAVETASLWNLIIWHYLYVHKSVGNGLWLFSYKDVLVINRCTYSKVSNNYWKLIIINWTLFQGSWKDTISTEGMLKNKTTTKSK